MEGYDLRKRTANRMVTSSHAPDNPIAYESIGFRHEQETLSYRTETTGEIVPDYIADPYAYFLQNSAARKREELKKKVKLGKAISHRDDKYPPHVDNGHSFYTVRRTCRTSYQSTHSKYYVANYVPPKPMIGGPFFALYAQIRFPQAYRMPFMFAGNGETEFRFGQPLPKLIGNQSAIQNYGRKAILAVAPNRPNVNGMGAGLEFIRDLPRLPLMLLLNSKEGLRKKVSSEYLNAQFGVVPTANDMIKIGLVLKDISVHLIQYEKDAAKGVRRRFTSPISDVTEVFSQVDLSSQGEISLQNSPLPVRDGRSTSDWNIDKKSAKSSITMRERKEMSFSGSFSYYLPNSDGFSGRVSRYVAQLNKVLGLSVGFETTWQLTPWSWLVDWFIDVRSSLALHDRLADDSLVINYGYVMAETFRSATQHTELTYNADRISAPLFVATTVTSSRKERVRCNPYGFIAPGATELTPFRLSILAALGMNRTR